MAIEVQIKHPAAGMHRVLRFAQSPVRIGRNQLNDISLEDPFVSEWHGIIRHDDRQMAYFDLGSTNGTRLNGKRLAKNVPAPLSHASRLQLGTLEISVALRPDEVNAVDVSSGRVESGPLKTLGWGIPGSSSWPPPADEASGAVRVDAPASGPWPARSLPSTDRPSAPPAATPARDPGPRAPDAGSARPELIARQAKVIEAFSEAFIGLRKGYEQFGAEVGVRTVSGTTPLHRARSAREVVDYLLLPSVDAAATTKDLIAMFADFGIHHIALLEGVTQGVRVLLQSLHPRPNPNEGGAKPWGKSKIKIKGHWKGYLEKLDLLLSDDDELHATIFGDAFARAYASVTVGDGRGPRPGKDS